MPSAEDHPLYDLPITVRIDTTLAVLSRMKRQRKGGWSLDELADLCGCTKAAIVARQNVALRKIAARAPEILPLLPRYRKPTD